MTTRERCWDSEYEDKPDALEIPWWVMGVKFGQHQGNKYLQRERIQRKLFVNDARSKRFRPFHQKTDNDRLTDSLNTLTQNEVKRPCKSIIKLQEDGTYIRIK